MRVSVICRSTSVWTASAGVPASRFYFWRFTGPRPVVAKRPVRYPALQEPPYLQLTVEGVGDPHRSAGPAAARHASDDGKKALRRALRPALPAPKPWVLLLSPPRSASHRYRRYRGPAAKCAAGGQILPGARRRGLVAPARRSPKSWPGAAAASTYELTGDRDRPTSTQTSCAVPFPTYRQPETSTCAAPRCS